MKIFFVYIVLFAFSFSLFAQSDEIVGKWKFTDNSREIEIYKEYNKYFGKILKTSGENNTEKVGHVLFIDFIYNQTEMKYAGKINSPSGITASGKLSLFNKNELKISISKFFINKNYTMIRII